MRQRSRQIVKLDDVAAKAGVSPSTVSLYIRQPDRVSEKTGKKIQSAIDSLGYVHNKIASQFTGGQSSNMAIVLPSLANSFFSHVVQRIESTVSAQGFQLSIASHDHSLDKEEEQIRSILQWSPAVIAIAGADHKPSTLKMLRNSGVPVVQMWQVDGGAFPAQVGNNHTEIGYAAARFLLDAGCQELAYFTTRFDDDIRARWFQPCAGRAGENRAIGRYSPCGEYLAGQPGDPHSDAGQSARAGWHFLYQRFHCHRAADGSAQPRHRRTRKAEHSGLRGFSLQRLAIAGDALQRESQRQRYCRPHRRNDAAHER